MINTTSWHNTFKNSLSLSLAGLLWLNTWAVQAQVERIVAVVEDDVILSSELRQRVSMLAAKLADRQRTQMPPTEVLNRQVLERMILERLQLQLAQRSGIQVNEAGLREAMQRLADSNGMTLAEFLTAIRTEGISETQFRQDLRNEMLIGRLRNTAVSSQVKVTEREVEHFMATQAKQSFERDKRYHLAHILIATPEAASPTQIQKTRERAQRLLDEIQSGLDFQQAALTASDGPQALTGGDLGWRKLDQIPTLFVDLVSTMKAGDISDLVRSPSGFHILKMLELKGDTGQHMIRQTHARHILIKPTEVLSDEEARNKLLTLKQRIEEGDDFGELARAHSDDKVSALKDGDLDWVTPGMLVPEFEQAMQALTVDQISDPVQTQFGWHLIQVLERKERDDTQAYQKQQAHTALRARKIEEETELWLRRLRDEAYVEIRLNYDR